MSVSRRASSSFVCVSGALGLLASSHCGHHAIAPPASDVVSALLAAPDRGAALATVDGEPVSLDAVRVVAAAEGISDPHAALERTVALRLLAREARRRGRTEPALLAAVAQRAMVQLLVVRTIDLAIGPAQVPASMVDTTLAQRRFELAHGELYRTQHAIAIVPATATAAQRQEARAVAEQFRTLALAAPQPLDAATFRTLAERASTPSVHLRVEDLPPIEATGRGATMTFVSEYAAGASALRDPGQISPVTQSAFGYHVIRLVERTPPVVRTPAEVTAIVRADLVPLARRDALEKLLTALRARWNVTMNPAALNAVQTARLGFGDS